MKPVDQTTFGAGEGDCLAACIATILGIPLAEIPNVCAESAGPQSTWLERLNAWLRSRGWVAVLVEGGPGPWADGLPLIVTGPSPRGLLHATVWRGGEMVHDPHPSRAGISEPLDTLLLVPVNPTRDRDRLIEDFALTPTTEDPAATAGRMYALLRHYATALASEVPDERAWMLPGRGGRLHQARHGTFAFAEVGDANTIEWFDEFVERIARAGKPEGN